MVIACCFRDQMSRVSTKIYDQLLSSSPKHTPQATNPVLIAIAPLLHRSPVLTLSKRPCEGLSRYSAIKNPHGICTSGPERPSVLRILFSSALDSCQYWPFRGFEISTQQLRTESVCSECSSESCASCKLMQVPQPQKPSRRLFPYTSLLSVNDQPCSACLLQHLFPTMASSPVIATCVASEVPEYTSLCGDDRADTKTLV